SLLKKAVSVDLGAQSKELHLADAYTLLCKTERQQRNYDDALADCNKALEVDGEYLPAYYYRGLVEVVLDKDQQALADFYKALDISPINSSTMYVNQGKAFK